MSAGCEHEDSAIMGKCAICENMVCSECFQTLFNGMICAEHSDLEDEAAWEMLGFYVNTTTLDERRYYLNEQGIMSIVNENEDQVSELYVPIEQKDEAFEALAGDSDETNQCVSCKVFYSKEAGACPICGVGEVTQ